VQEGAANKQATVEPGGEAFDFAAVIDRYQTPLLRYVGHLMGRGPEAAEEVVQDAFMRLIVETRRHGTGSVRKLSSWLFRVAHNQAISALRKLSKDDKLEQRDVQDAVTARFDPDESSDMLNDMIHREMCDRAVEELNNLPSQQKQVLLLKLLQGFTLHEIGDIVGLSVSNVSYRLSQGLRELAIRLKNAGVI